jgi:DNA-binding CsgD family transcriptional regulator
VYSDFLKRLGEQYTHLSPNDFRLCAYLRMNLSSKEIASLMNISIRGVEASRYRLRKRLDLDTETNLTEFLIRF